METSLSAAYIIAFWMVLLGMMTALAKILFNIRYGSVKDMKFFVRQDVEGVALPESEKTRDVRNALYLFAVSAGFMLVSITTLGFILLMKVPEEIMALGIAAALLSHVLIVITGKKIKNLSS